MPDLTSLAGPLASLVAAISALPLGRLAQNRREAKVRTSIEASIKVVKELEGLSIDNKQALNQKIEVALENDLDTLARLVQARNREKRRNWASLAVAVFAAGLLTIPLWFLWKPATTLSWSLFLFCGISAALLLLGGVLACFNPPEGADEGSKKSRSARR